MDNQLGKKNICDIVRNDKSVAGVFLLPANFELDKKMSQKDSLPGYHVQFQNGGKSYVMELFTQIKMLCCVLLMPKKKMASHYFLVD